MRYIAVNDGVDTLNKSAMDITPFRNILNEMYAADISVKPKNCTVCGVEYVPCSAISKYCPECRKKIRKVRGTETKRRSRERNRQACIELSAKNDRLMSVH